ncbi:type I secretion system permease/ATPase [Rubellimicrobium arenae]|uniref:type I secretion system permease/ATPase n=1 Tax=Rubellimicrobium arenae TaxID=2817372 RepID=UPI001B30D078|nr:type I secretion system permease/ATPase [Rubellimicrobium arenae]
MRTMAINAVLPSQGDMRPAGMPAAAEEIRSPKAAPAQGLIQPRAALEQALRGLRRTCAVVFGFSIILNILMLTGSIYMLQVYDRVLSSRSVETLVALFGIVVVLYAFLGFFDFLRARILGLAAVRLDQVLGTQAFGLFLRSGLPAVSRGASATNEPSPQPLQNLDTLRSFISGGTMGALFDVPLVPLYLGVLFLVHPVLGWLTVAGALVTAMLAMLNHLLTRKPIAQTMAREAMERDLVDRSRRGAEAIFGMGMQAALMRRWQQYRQAALAAGQTSGHPAEVLSATSRAFRMFLQSAILTAGAWLVIQGEISGGMIVASSILSGRALAPVDQIIGGWRGIQKAVLARRSLERVLSDAPAAARIVELPEPKGQFEVRDLTKLAPVAQGQGERRPLLDKVTFALEPGDGLAVIGNSGSGKSTLVRALMGIVRPDSGEVRLDGATLDQWDPARLGRFVGYLPQLPDLLPGTARDVIARFDPEVTDATVIEAARMVGIHDMILALPQGYATEIGGATGAVLSGGQMQRLGLARAVCGMPRLIVLDEPNAHLDAAGDEALGQVITRLRDAGSVVIVVTHRPAAMAALNKVLVLKDGQVHRFGPIQPAQEHEVPAPANLPLSAGPQRQSAELPVAARQPWEPFVVRAGAEAASGRPANDPEIHREVQPAAEANGASEAEFSPPPNVAAAMKRLADQRAARSRAAAEKAHQTMRMS